MQQVGDKPLDSATIDRPDSPIRLPTLDPMGPKSVPTNKSLSRKRRGSWKSSSPPSTSKIIKRQKSWAISAMNPTAFESCRKCFPQEVLDAAASAGRSGPPRRVALKSFCADQGLNATSDAANFGYLMTELRGPKKSSVDKLKGTINLSDAVRTFKKEFEAAAIKRYPLRERWGTLALNSFSHQNSTLSPAVTRLLDPDLTYRVVDQKQSNGANYWLIKPNRRARRTSVDRRTRRQRNCVGPGRGLLPLPSGLVPADVEDQFDTGFTSPPPETDHPISVASTDTAASIFAVAKEQSGRLVTHNVPGTKNGHLACAWAVNEIAKLAIGKPIGGRLSSDRMAQALNKNHVRLQEADIVPGAIIICPSQAWEYGTTSGLSAVSATQGRAPIFIQTARAEGVHEEL